MSMDPIWHEGILTLSQTTNFRLLNLKNLQMTISNVIKMAKNCPNGKKTLWENEKLLVTSNFSFPYSVFKRLVPKTRKNQGLFWKGLTLSQTTNLESSKMKEFETTISHFMTTAEMGKNTVGKGEITRFQIARVFKRFILQTFKSQGLFGKIVNCVFRSCIQHQTIVV